MAHPKGVVPCQMYRDSFMQIMFAGILKNNFYCRQNFGLSDGVKGCGFRFARLYVALLISDQGRNNMFMGRGGMYLFFKIILFFFPYIFISNITSHINKYV